MISLRQNVIFPPTLIIMLSAVVLLPAAPLAGDLERRIDSLFVIASSGEIRFLDQNDPAMDSIAAFGAAAVPHLIDKFTTKSNRERRTIIWILERIGSEAVPDLVQALKRNEWLVVQRVCWALGDIKDTAAIRPLVGVCNHSRWQVREMAVEAIGKIGNPAAEDTPRGGLTVLEALIDTIGQVRKAATVAFGKLGMTRPIELLVHVLGDNFYGARMAAAETLLDMDTAATLGALRDSMNSENRLVGDIACRILGEIGNDDALEILLGQALNGDPERRSQAATALISADPLDNCGYRKRLLDRETDRFVLLKMQSAIDNTRDEE